MSVKNIFPGQDLAAFTGRNFYSVGLHPWYIGSRAENNEKLSLIEEALELDHVILVGECGLDRISDTSFNEQQHVFEAQAFMAEEHEMPLIIHCVKAYNEVIALHNKLHPLQPWILHGYSGNIEITRQLAERNIFFSFGEILFMNEAKAIESFQILPVQRIFFETDEYSGGIEEIYKKGAELKNMPVDHLKQNIWNNFNILENVKWNG